MNYLKFLWRLLAPWQQWAVIGVIGVIEAALIWRGFNRG